MLATLADAAAHGPAAGLRAEVRRHPRAGRDDARRRAERRSRSGPASATRRPAQFPPDRRRGPQGGGPPPHAAAARRRDCRARRPTAGPAGFQRLQGRIHLTRAPTRSPSSNARSRSRSSCSTCCATATTTCADCPSTERRARLEARLGTPDVGDHPAQRTGGRRRTRAARARPHGRLGRPDRQGRDCALSQRQAAAPPGAS